jgi:hypothetical protein
MSEVNYDVEILKALDLPLTEEYYLALVYPKGIPDDVRVEFPPEIKGKHTNEK